MDLKKRLPGTQVAEILIAVAVILWRIWALPLTSLWLDWVTLLSLYWIAASFASESRAWKVVTVVGMALLMLLYGWGQIPHVINHLRSIS